MSKLKSLADSMFNGDIAVFDGAQGVQTFKSESQTFSKARDIAREHSGDIVVFKGTFPDGRERAQATVSVPQGQSPNTFREKLSQVFGTESASVSGNHFMRGSEGHHYLSLTIDL